MNADKRRRCPFLVLLLAALLAGTTVLAGCGAATGAASTAPAAGGIIRVVAAENCWGSIAAQIGGRYVAETSIITNPNDDPHVYEPTPADGRTVATADLVVENGIGYDPWMAQLLAAEGRGPKVIDIGTLLGVPDGGNPHRWYNPGDVLRFVAAYTADLAHLAPAHAAYFRAQAATFEHVGLGPYDAEIAAIKARYAGTPVGASESIFAMLAPALGLDLITPTRFLDAISEGTDVSAADKATIDDQIRHHLIKIYVYNRQNTTPDVQAQLAECRAAGIPTATITETLDPADATYQAWQTSQLDGIAAALAAAHAATHR